MISSLLLAVAVLTCSRYGTASVIHEDYDEECSLNSLKVATWNVASFEQGTKEEIAQAILRQAESADVIMLQEDIQFLPDGSRHTIKEGGSCRTQSSFGQQPGRSSIAQATPFLMMIMMSLPPIIFRHAVWLWPRSAQK